MVILWIYHLLFISVLANDNIERASYCYGDSSGGSSNLVDASCTSGAVYINDVITATKPSSQNCPMDDHAYSPAEQIKCCTYTETDCTKSFSGSWQNFLKCNGQKTCSGVPVVRDEPICSDGDFPRFSNYMVLEYYCMPAGFNYGPCNTTADCNDPAAKCDKSFCECQDGYTTFFAFDDCWRDGGLNGSCTGPVGCQDAHTYCDFASGRCQCDVGFFAYNGSCVQGGYNFGYCVSTADCTDPQAMCDTSVCVCEDGYTAFAEFDDCWKDGGLNGSCAGSIGCQDNFTSCDSATNRCKCITGYAPTAGHCYADGELHGYCQSNGDCADANAACTNERCECVTGYRDIAGICRQDGRLHGFCETGNIECVDNNTKCENGVCNCENEYSAINGICKEDGELGGLCTEDSDCTDENAKCVTIPSNSAMAICECKDGYRNIDGECIKDGELHGYCQSDGDCADTNAACTNERCECVTSYRDFAGICRQDGRLHGYCETGTTDCVDSNTKCENGVCNCEDEYTAINGTCKRDGELGGLCTEDSDCTDENAKCVTMPANSAMSICECKDGFTNINGNCIEDGTLYGLCTGSVVCKDNNTVCNSTSSRCECSTGYVPYIDACYADGDLHGFCTQDADCQDGNAKCTNQRCECIEDFRDIDGICREDGHLLGFCEVTVDCIDDNSECSEGICVCIDGYTDVDGSCIKDGDLGGACGENNHCADENADCEATLNSGLSLCTCTTNYTNIGGECKQDRRVGGRCTSTNTCLDALSNCSTQGICTCIAGHSEVNDMCKEDGKEGGVCGQSGQGDQGVCSEENAECQTDTQRQCGGSNCVPGVCKCKINYHVGYYGTCTKDGDVGGVCNFDSDCKDANAYCIGDPLFCMCSTGYRDVDGTCVKDGDPGGYCLSGNICSDPHSICVNGTCICNDKRNYIRKAGRCQRNDTFINGECKEDDDSVEEDEIACLDTNAQCSGNKCICRTGFSQTNGICTIGNISSVTACNGSSPYNQLVPDCDLDYVPVILETYQRVKPASKNCPDQVNLYSDTIFSQCCSYEDGDCRIDSTEDDACSPTDLSGDYTTYTVIDYVCAPDGSVIDAAADTDVQNNQVYVVGVSGQRQCSVTASCKTDISVYIVFLTLNEVNSQCNQTLIITEGTDATTFDCGYQGTNSEEAVFTSSSGFFTFNITNPDQGGRFVLEIQAEITTADVIVACGSQAASEGPDTFGKCGAEAGRLRGNCSSEIICKDPHTICENGICQCQNGYREFETECLEIVTEEDDKSSASALLAVIIPVAILLTLAIAGAAFWLLKNKIRKKCFPEKEAALIQPINGGPSPMNVKYPGRGAPSDVGIPKVMPPPWTNSGWSPMNEKFRGNTDIKSALPARLPPISSSPMNTKFSGPSSNPENVADYLYKEEMSAENNLQKKRKTKKNSISPREDNIIKVGSVANGHAVSENTQDINKKQKKNKKPKKSKIGIKTKQSFKLPTHPGETTEGVFTPTQSFYSVPQQGQNVMNGAPSLNQSLQPQNMPYLATPSGHLPPLSASFHSGRPQMNGGVQSFDPRSSWRTAGSVASIAVQPKLRRPSVLDIQSVDDPTNIEHTELSN